MHKDSILFIITGYYLNGGSTFLLRICSALKDNNMKVGVLFLKNEGDINLLDSLHEVADIRYVCTAPLVRAAYPLSILLKPAKSLRCWIESFDSVHAMGIFSLLYAVFNTIGSRLTIGVYQQDEYLSSVYNNFYAQKFAKKMLAEMPIGILFFNEENLKRYQKELGFSDDRARVAPIGIDELPYRELSRNGRVVSVGSLTPFKTYFGNTIKALAELKMAGFEVSYDIYGEGETMEDLFELVVSLDLQSQVNFKGKLTYSDFSDVVSAYSLLIGSGTVVPEASMLGVPSMVGCENEHELVTYGLLSDFTGLSYNERGIAGLKQYSLPDRILSVLNSDASVGDTALGVAAWRRAGDFSISTTVQGFSSLVENMPRYGGVQSATITKLRVFGSLVLMGVLSLFGNKDYRARKAAVR